MVTRSRDYDVVVAGAGPAGSALAGLLASGGATVLLLERGAVPGEGRDWIVDVERGTCKVAGVPEPVGESMWIEPAVQMLSSPDRSRRVTLRSTPIMPLRNAKYVEQLTGWAVENGAELRTGSVVTAPVLKGGAVAGVSFEGAGEAGEVTARIVADCTGIGGMLRRGTPAGWGMRDSVAPQDLVLARRDVRKIDREGAVEAVARGEIENRVRVDRPGVMGTYSTESLYLDIEEGYIDILYGLKSDPALPTADEMFDRLFARWPFIGDPIFGGGASIPIARPLDSLVGEGFVILGDSGCQVIPAHGSGTASALLAARLASTTVLEALREERYDRSALWSYPHAFMTGRGAVLAHYYALRVQVEKREAADLNNLIAKGLMTEGQMHSGLIPEPYSPPIGEALSLLRSGLAELPLLAFFARAALRARRIERHYRKYPRVFSEGNLSDWSAGSARILGEKL